MRKIILGIITFAIAFAGILAPATPVFAQDACEITGNTDPLICGDPKTDEERALMERVRNILETVYLWIGIIAVIVIVISGVKYMTSAGNSEKVVGAKRTLTFALVGLVVTLSAFAITEFFIGALEGQKPGESGKIATPSDEGHDKVRAIRTVGTVNIVAGQKGKINASVIPDYAKNQTITFESADPSIITIDTKGNIKALKDGTTTIKAASPEGPSKDIKVTVIRPVEVQTVSLSKNTVTLVKGKSTTIKAKIIPNNAADKTLTWATQDSKIATVDQKGKIKGIKEGITTITATARNQVTYTAMSGENVLASAPEMQLAATGPVVAKVKVTVQTDTYGVQGPTTNTKYSKSLKFTPTTQAIINKHKKDFDCSNFKSFMKKHGGYTAYVKSLGGVFATFADKKPTIKTAADFQAAAEYVYGLWTIWGPDYNNYYSTSCSTCHYVNWKGSDAFYHSCPGQRHLILHGYVSGKSINSALKKSDKVRTHCNGSVDTFIASTNLKKYASAANPSGLLKHGKKITKVKDLQPGDILAFYSGGSWRHTAIVGEVYKDYVVTYDGGSTSMKKGNFKRMYKRDGSNFYKGYTWYAVRVWNIDQSKTLEGLK